ncbi:MAG TPA: nucleotidyltransferase domain-containing protein [Candidatus Ratteibacteria bacterium]|nr:nucleotidyltransferase domain-containing protein [Candidatus Ratteibacteria bacterium]
MENKYFEKFLDELKEKCLKFYKNNLVSIVIFGSYANGKNTPSSDIDILIILEKTKSNYERYIDFFSIIENIKVLKQLKNKNIYPLISPIIKSAKYLNVKLPYLWSTKFRIIYDKNHFFSNFLRELEEFIENKIEFFDTPMPHYIIKNGQ